MRRDDKWGLLSNDTDRRIAERLNSSISIREADRSPSDRSSGLFWLRAPDSDRDTGLCTLLRAKLGQFFLGQLDHAWARFKLLKTGEQCR